MDEESTRGMLCLFLCELPAYGGGIHRRNAYSARNYYLIDEESTGGMLIPPGFTISWMRDPPED
jgi:hypothetical protein